MFCHGSVQKRSVNSASLQYTDHIEGGNPRLTWIMADNATLVCERLSSLHEFRTQGGLGNLFISRDWRWKSRMRSQVCRLQSEGLNTIRTNIDNPSRNCGFVVFSSWSQLVRRAHPEKFERKGIECKENWPRIVSGWIWNHCTCPKRVGAHFYDLWNQALVSLFME